LKKRKITIYKICRLIVPIKTLEKKLETTLH
jgi:hypothetical protein